MNQHGKKRPVRKIRKAVRNLELTQQEAAKQEAARLEAARFEAARLEVERQAAERQAAVAKREALLKEIGRQLNEEADRREAAAAAAARLPSSVSSLRRGRLFGRSDPNTELILYAEAWARKIQMNMTIEMVREAAKQPHAGPGSSTPLSGCNDCATNMLASSHQLNLGLRCHCLRNVKKARSSLLR